MISTSISISRSQLAFLDNVDLHMRRTRDLRSYPTFHKCIDIQRRKHLKQRGTEKSHKTPTGPARDIPILVILTKSQLFQCKRTNGIPDGRRRGTAQSPPEARKSYRTWSVHQYRSVEANLRFSTMSICICADDINPNFEMSPDMSSIESLISGCPRRSRAKIQPFLEYCW